MIVPSTVFGQNAPSNRITLGCIGVGRMGRGDMFDSIGNGFQVVAVCDVDANRMADAKRDSESRMKSKGVREIPDFRDLIAREDIDAVNISTPDHWHAIPAIEAARARKDIFLQKPLTYTIEEGRTLVDAVKRYGVVFQVGSQQRSDARFRKACELVRNGYIGELKTVKIGVGVDRSCGVQPAMPVPKNLNYELWLGPAQSAPYTEARVHPQKGYGRPGWLRTRDYTHGMVTGWGSHHVDITHWGLGMEGSGPIEIDGKGEYAPEGLWDVHLNFDITYKYANGITANFAHNRKNKQGVLFEGTKGWVYVRRGFIDANPKSLLRQELAPDELHLYSSRNHKANFRECILSRGETVAPVENGHRSNSACVLGSLSMLLGRKIRWNPNTEQIIGDDEASRMLRRPMRGNWHL